MSNNYDHSSFKADGMRMRAVYVSETRILILGVIQHIKWIAATLLVASLR